MAMRFALKYDRSWIRLHSSSTFETNLNDDDMKCAIDVSMTLVIRWVFICFWKSIVRTSNALNAKRWFVESSNWLGPIYSTLASYVIIATSVLANRRSRWCCKYVFDAVIRSGPECCNGEAFANANSYGKLSLIDCKEAEMVDASHWRREVSMGVLLALENEEIWEHFFMLWLSDWHTTHWCFQEQFWHSRSWLKRLQ